jgi:hypothetical protein
LHAEGGVITFEAKLRLGTQGLRRWFLLGFSQLKRLWRWLLFKYRLRVLILTLELGSLLRSLGSLLLQRLRNLNGLLESTVLKDIRGNLEWAPILVMGRSWLLLWRLLNYWLRLFELDLFSWLLQITLSSVSHCSCTSVGRSILLLQLSKVGLVLGCVWARSDTFVFILSHSYWRRFLVLRRGFLSLQALASQTNIIRRFHKLRWWRVQIYLSLGFGWLSRVLLLLLLATSRCRLGYPADWWICGSAGTPICATALATTRRWWPLQLWPSWVGLMACCSCCWLSALSCWSISPCNGWLQLGDNLLDLVCNLDQLLLWLLYFLSGCSSRIAFETVCGPRYVWATLFRGRAKQAFIRHCTLLVQPLALEAPFQRSLLPF